MKKIVLTLTVAMIGLAAYAQGLINFGNSASSLITTNGGTPATTGPLAPPNGSFVFELYMGTVGQTEDQLRATGITNYNQGSPVRGRLLAASRVVPAGTAGLNNTGVSNYVAVQIRGWSANLGNSWADVETAVAGGASVGWWGRSAVGTYMLGPALPPPSWTVMVGGTPPAGVVQVPGFELVPVPEPSTIALGVLGLAGLFFVRRRK